MPLDRLLLIILLPIFLFCCCAWCIGCIFCGCFVMLLRSARLMPPIPEDEEGQNRNQQQPQQQPQQPPKSSIVMSTTALAPPLALAAVADMEEGLT